MRIVIKIGTSTLTYPTWNMNLRRVEELCKVMADVKNAGHEVILVSSGAIAMGVGKLGLKTRPSDVTGKQAAAAVGQCELMYVYDRLFADYNHTVAQLLLTGEDMRDDIRHQNFSNTLTRLLELGVLPIINENDTVSTDEISLSDNDTLGALVAVSVKADMLILLSDIDGLYTGDPHVDKTAMLIPEITEIDEKIESLGGGKGSNRGTGGMKTKLGAAKLCMNNGVEMVIANGATPSLIYDIVDGKCVGTRFKKVD